MASTPDDVATALHGTVLAGMPVRDVDGGALLLEGIDPTRVLDCWQVARDALPRTGRWPVAVWPEWHVEFGALSSEWLDAVARDLPAVGDERRFPRYVHPVPSAQSAWHGLLEHYFPGGGLPDVMARDLADPVLDDDVDRWVFDQLQGDPALAASVDEAVEPWVGTRPWFTPDRADLLLLPTTSPWLAIPALGYFGAESDPNALAAALRQWHDAWGAELVAAWGTMLQLVVRRRPRQGEEAWELAGQLLAWGGSLQVHRWQLAQALPRSDAWFLHDRP